MDRSAEEITFDSDGICNFCRVAMKSLEDNKKESENIKSIIDDIRRDGRSYDCLIGLSGGVDSSTVLHNAVKWGLKPLCFSLDNGWNNPNADENVLRMVEKLRVPYLKHVVDFSKFTELQGAFLKAGVKNIEIPTDHVLMAISLEMANKYGIKWILSGGNTATESIMPASWGYNARDLVHIEDIYTKMTGKKLSGLPVCGLIKWNWYKWVKGIKTFYPLDYIEYDREESIKMLEKEYGYKDYGEKHCESVFTQWFQNFYLFHKFGIDKRKAHLSSLINSGQMTRKQALKEIAKSPEYPKIGLETKVMQYPKRSHYVFKTDERLFNFISSVVRKLKWLF